MPGVVLDVNHCGHGSGADWRGGSFASRSDVHDVAGAWYTSAGLFAGGAEPGNCPSSQGGGELNAPHVEKAVQLVALRHATARSDTGVQIIRLDDHDLVRMVSVLPREAAPILYVPLKGTTSAK